MKKIVFVMLILLSTTQAQSNDLIIDGTFTGEIGKVQLEEPGFIGSGVCIKFLGFIARGVFVVVPSCEKGQHEYYYNVKDLPISIVPENTKKSYLISFVDTNIIMIQVGEAAIEQTENKVKEWEAKKEKEKKEAAKKKLKKVYELLERAKLAPMGSLEKEMLLNEAELLNR